MSAAERPDLAARFEVVLRRHWPSIELETIVSVIGDISTIRHAEPS